MKFILIFVWFILFMWIVTLGCDLISTPNTVKMLLGLVLIFGAVFISAKTECFTNIKFKKKK